MSIFTWLFRSRDKPQNRVGSSLSFLFGSTTSGKTVNERTAMQATAVYACVRILAEAIAGLPLHVYRYRADGGKERVPQHPLYYLLHDEPNPEMTSFVFRETLMSHLLYGQRLRADYTQRPRTSCCFVPSASQQDRGQPGGERRTGLQLPKGC